MTMVTEVRVLSSLILGWNYEWSVVSVALEMKWVVCCVCRSRLCERKGALCIICALGAELSDVKPSCMSRVWILKSHCEQEWMMVNFLHDFRAEYDTYHFLCCNHHSESQSLKIGFVKDWPPAVSVLLGGTNISCFLGGTDISCFRGGTDISCFLGGTDISFLGSTDNCCFLGVTDISCFLCGTYISCFLGGSLRNLNIFIIML